jgi:hypothetical protein
MRVRTQLAHSEDLTEHLGQLDAAPPERTLVLVLAAAVLQDDLWTGGGKERQQCYRSVREGE